jgi:hypothetical protein
MTPIDRSQPPGNLLRIVVDHLFPDLDAYEASLYIYFFRKTLLVGEESIRIGKKSLATGFVRGRRGGGTKNRGGAQVNFGHISSTLKGLASKGCIQIGDTTREGTLYVLRHPADIPSVASRFDAAIRDWRESVGNAVVERAGYFSDPARRKEVFERDHWACRYCGERLTPENSTLDHYIPQSKGGNDSKENLRAACLMCNSVKSGRSFEEAAPLLVESIVARRTSGA